MAVARFKLKPAVQPPVSPPSSPGVAEPQSAPSPPPPPQPAPREPINFLEDFSTDRLDSYDFDFGSRADVKVEDGVLKRKTTADANLCTKPELAVGEPTVTYKFTTGGNVGSDVSQYPDITIKRFGGSANRLQVDYQVGDRRFKIFREVAGKRTDVVLGPRGAGPLKAANTPYWIRASIRGNVVRGEIFVADPATGSSPAGSIVRTLVNTEDTDGDGVIDDDATRFGAHAVGTTCIAPHVYKEAELAGWSVDDWRVTG